MFAEKPTLEGPDAIRRIASKLGFRGNAWRRSPARTCPGEFRVNETPSRQWAIPFIDTLEGERETYARDTPRKLPKSCRNVNPVAEIRPTCDEV